MRKRRGKHSTMPAATRHHLRLRYVLLIDHAVHHLFSDKSALHLLSGSTASGVWLQWAADAHLELKGGILQTELLIIASSPAACCLLEHCLQPTSQVSTPPLLAQAPLMLPCTVLLSSLLLLCASSPSGEHRSARCRLLAACGSRRSCTKPQWP